MINFTESEIEATKKLVDERWKDKDVSIHLADIEYTKEGEEAVNLYPALVWEDKSSTFVVLKMGMLSYKSFFYYLKNKRYDTGVLEYNDLNECVTTLMQSQADLILSKVKEITNKSTSD
jgi:hypothetical protein